MNVNKKRISTVSIPLLIALSELASPSHADAEEISIGVYPAVTEITARPGETLGTTVMVKNYSDTEVTVTTLLQPFAASENTDGSIRYLNEAPDIFRNIQVRENGESVSEIPLQPGQEKKLNLQLRIPEDDTARDYYFSLVLLSKPLAGDIEPESEIVTATSTISSGVASHFLLSINPPQTRRISLTDFSTPPLSAQSPVPFIVKAANIGPNVTTLSGDIEIRTVFGNLAERVQIPPTRILSQTTRALSDASQNHLQSRGQTDTSNLPRVSQQEKLLPGIYRADISLRTDTSSAAIQEQLYFAVAPLEVILGILACAILLFLLIKRLRVKRTEKGKKKSFEAK